ncbi:MAG: tRNA pseudouridine(55) synthase TruB [Bacilli bacterium]
MNGIILVNKHKSCTSRDVVNDLCKIFNTKKIGHTGTLDPNATGLLVLGINEGTKIIDLINKSDKEYVAQVILGIQTDTYDITGKVLYTSDVSNISDKQILEVLKKYKGIINQKVPKYSAVKVNGKRLYEYARENLDVEIPSKDVNIYTLDLISEIKREDNKIYFTIKTKVSSGTYIRSLIYDIGKDLKVSSCMGDLNRTSHGNFSLDNAYTVEEIRQNNFNMLNFDDSLKHLKRYEISLRFYKKIMNGIIIDNEYEEDKILFVYKNKVIAIYQVYDKDNTKMKPYRIFNKR